MITNPLKDLRFQAVVPGTCHVSQVRVVPRHVAVAVAVAVVQHVVTRRHVAARREVARVRADLENIFTFLTNNKYLCNYSTFASISSTPVRYL